MARKLTFDKVLFTAVVLLVVLGLVMVYSSSIATGVAGAELRVLKSPFAKQSIAAGLGLCAMVVVMSFDYRHLKKPWLLYPGIGAVAALLVAVLYAPERNESHRWIYYKGLSLQPSELAKLALVVFLAYQLDRKWESVNRPAFILPTAIFVSAIVLLVVVEPDLGTATILMMVASVMLFLGGIAWRYVVGVLIALLPLFWFSIMMVPYRRERLLSFLSPELDPLDSGYQAMQSLIAIGSGGVWGVGLGQSGQKLQFLPLANSDFIFAILGEELGLVGGAAVLSLFLLVGWRALRAGHRAPDHFGRFLAWGLCALILLQALIHASITLQLLPVTGTPLPLISYGGTALMCNLVACGLLLNVSQHGV